jgi:hypothetical protein
MLQKGRAPPKYADSSLDAVVINPNIPLFVARAWKKGLPVAETRSEERCAEDYLSR